ncbi:MAG: tetratricopeptide repeat protein [Chloracidobacterium sp.]|nr:tetratricopeptide repeat protein [Chloracidobacterium sp.]
MKRLTFLLVLCAATAAQAENTFAQGASEICGDSAGSNWNADSAVFGRITLRGFERSGKLPKITVTLIDRNRSEHRYTIDRNGNYCFRGIDGGGGQIVVDVEENEIIRRSLPSSTTQLRQHRQDFELNAPDDRQRPPSTVSARYSYPREGENAALFERAAEAERKKDRGTAVKLLKELVGKDAKDFVAWGRLGSIYFEQSDLKAAEAAYTKALDARPDFGFGMMNLGRIYLVQNKVDAAIEILLRSTQADPTAPRAFQLLGEAYLLAKKGTLGVEALTEAIRLDPVGMAECHLLMARLYDRAGARSWASREYQTFLKKVPDHAEKKKFEKYIKDNPPEPDEQ